MLFTNIILIFVLILNFVFLFMLYKKDNPLVRAFRFVNLGIIVWTIPVFSWPFVQNYKALYILGIIAYWGPLLVSYSFLRFSYLFPRNDNFVGKKIRISFFVLFLISIFITLIPGFVLKGVGLQGYSLVTGPGIYLLFFIIAFFIIVSLIILYYKYLKLSGVYKYQIKYLFLGFIISVVIAFVSNAILALMEIYQFVWLGPAVTLVLIGFSTYSITRYRLMGIKVIVSKIYFYLIVSVFAYIFFYFVYFLETKFLGGVLSDLSLSVGFIISIFFAFVFLRVLNYTQKTSDSLFFKGYNPKRVIKDLTIKLNNVIELDELLEILAGEFRKILKTENIGVVIFNGHKENQKENKNLKANSKTSFQKNIIAPEWGEIEGNKEMINYLRNKRDLVVANELKEKSPKIARQMEKRKIEIASPLISKNKLIGVIFLGGKYSKDGYNQEDIEFLEIISNQAAVAIQNARFYSEVENFNETLQKKVNQQTSNIKKQNVRLQRLLKVRSEFLDIASHQLRTPISVIEGTLSMIREGSVPEKKKEEFIDSALQKSFKLEDIVDGILLASEVDSDKFSLDMRELQLEELVEAVYKNRKSRAEIKGINYELNLSKSKLPPIKGDERYLKVVLENLINNALQYTFKGSVKVEVKKNNDNILVLVSDTGIGIPQKDKTKLFDKFSRAGNAANIYTDGTGLGLYISKKIIQGHPGAKIYIKKTQVEKSSGFAVSLPVKKKLKKIICPTINTKFYG